MAKAWRIALLAAVMVCSGVCRADDWPQWLGPQRDGVWRETGLLEAFPKGGLPVVWRVAVEAGYSGPAVADGRVFVTDHRLTPGVKRPVDPFAKITLAGVERVLCVDQATGNVLWTHEYDCPYDMSYSAGPRTTPAVDGDRVYTLGAEGDLFCLDVKSGKVNWAKHLAGAKSQTPVWGFAAHPLVDGNKLIILSCGRDPAHGSGLVTAFDKMTGKVIWTALSADPPGYCPPMIYNAGGVRQLIIWDAATLTSLNPETGKVYWSEKFGPVKNGVSITTPRMYHDPNVGDLLMISSAGEGTMVMKLDAAAPKASVYWKRGGKSEKKTEALHSLMVPPTLRDGYIYGVCIGGELRCINLKNGDRLWETYDATSYEAGSQSWATAFLIPMGETGSRYLLANEHGDLLISELSPAGYKQISRTHLLNPTNSDAGRPVLWSFPAVAGMCIFWRNDKEMVCASMEAEKSK